MMRWGKSSRCCCNPTEVRLPDVVPVASLLLVIHSDLPKPPEHCWTCLERSCVLEWQFQLESIWRIGGCQSSGSSHTFPSQWSTAASQLGMHAHSRRGKKKKGGGRGGGSRRNRGGASPATGAQVMWKTLVRSHPASGGAVCFLFKKTPPTTILKLHRGLSGFLRDCLAWGTQNLLGLPH